MVSLDEKSVCLGFNFEINLKIGFNFEINFKN